MMPLVIPGKRAAGFASTSPPGGGGGVVVDARSASGEGAMLYG